MMFRSLCIASFVFCAILVNAQTYLIEDASQIAIKMRVNQNGSITHKMDNYTLGKVEIRSDAEQVVIGIDSDKNDVWDAFLILQTEGDQQYNLNEVIPSAQILFSNGFVLINSTKDDRRYTLSIETDDSLSSKNRVPANILASVKQNLVGYGISSYRGQFDFSDFMK